MSIIDYALAFAIGFWMVFGPWLIRNLYATEKKLRQEMEERE